MKKPRRRILPGVAITRRSPNDRAELHSSHRCRFFSVRVIMRADSGNIHRQIPVFEQRKNLVATDSTVCHFLRTPEIMGTGTSKTRSQSPLFQASRSFPALSSFAAVLQRLAKRTQVWFVALPPANRAAIQRLPYLNAAGGLYCALRLVESEAAVVPLQTAESNHLPANGFLVVDQFFVLNLKNGAGSTACQCAIVLRYSW